MEDIWLKYKLGILMILVAIINSKSISKLIKL